MLEQDLLKYCFYYKGEVLNPFDDKHQNEGRLWIAEKMVCEEFPYLVDEKDPQKQMASLIANFVYDNLPFR